MVGRVVTGRFVRGERRFLLGGFVAGVLLVLDRQFGLVAALAELWRRLG
jgi:hypothetical protein